ncbi:patched domain-containing protein 3-like [Polypterus senegalus]|nr:patched domain-containing protein 3-like [Polypterus senegalus]
MSKFHTDCIEKPVASGLEKLGRMVGRHPWWFLAIPLVCALALGGGFAFLTKAKANNIEEQFTPVNGPAKADMALVSRYFPIDETSFTTQRLITEGAYAAFIAVHPSGKILSEEALTEVLRIDGVIRNMTVSESGQAFTYRDICAQKNGECTPNAVLKALGNDVRAIGSIAFQFPLWVTATEQTFLGTTLRGVETNGSGIVQSAKAIRVFYFLKESEVERSDRWLREFLKVFTEDKNDFQLQETPVSYFTSVSRQEEFEINSKKVIPLFSITYFLAVFFSITSCLRFDCVRNKAWVATLGVLSAGIAVLSGFGLLLYCGVPFAMTVANSPFLILGIGIDDMFIMIACWQQTKVHDSVEDRMAETYREAAVSITITTLTDVLAFYIGINTPFRSVQSFCLYTGTAVLLCYVFNITFFGSVLALNGKREAENRHSLTCMKVPNNCPLDCSEAYSLCCVGGLYNVSTGTETEHPMNVFFKKYYGPFLTKNWTKVFVVLLYAGYLAASIYGCFQIKEGIDLRNLALDHSYIVRYYDHANTYFSEYGANIMVMIPKKADYWNNTVRKDIESCIDKLNDLPYIEKQLSVSWLKFYMIFAQRSNIVLDNQNGFINRLPAFFHLFPDFSQDVYLSGGVIDASRFFIQAVNITSAVAEKNMLTELREIAESCVVPLVVYHPAFIYFDQYLVIVSNTIQNTAVATVVMLVISLLLIPNPLCAAWVTFAIVSVIVGVAGFMAFWNINLDSISMINLVICIGFSVDFSAHISYAYVSSKKSTINEKATDALYLLGYPILQGAISTIVGVVVLAAAESYIFRTFFKIMFLVIGFGAVHGLVFIPVFLTFFGLCMKTGIVENAGTPENIKDTHSEAPSNLELQSRSVTESASRKMPFLYSGASELETDSS